MTKQLLIYDKAVPVSVQTHRDVSIKTGGDYGFARHVNSVPLMAAEFEATAGDYAIVFAGDAGEVMPAAMLGLRDRENLHVTESGSWTGKTCADRPCRQLAEKHPYIRHPRFTGIWVGDGT